MARSFNTTTAAAATIITDTTPPVQAILCDAPHNNTFLSPLASFPLPPSPSCRTQIHLPPPLTTPPPPPSNTQTLTSADFKNFTFEWNSTPLTFPNDPSSRLPLLPLFLEPPRPPQNPSHPLPNFMISTSPHLQPFPRPPCRATRTQNNVNLPKSLPSRHVCFQCGFRAFGTSSSPSYLLGLAREELRAR